MLGSKSISLVQVTLNEQALDLEGAENSETFTETKALYCTNVLPPQRGGAVPSPMGMGRNGSTDLPRGSTERSPPLSRTVFSLGRPLTSHNWAAPLLLIDRTPFRRLLILALLLISGNVQPNPGPISNFSHPRYPCSICHLDVGRDSLQCSACLKWVHFLCSSQGCHRNCTIKFQDFLRSFSRTFPGLFKFFFTRLKI